MKTQKLLLFLFALLSVGLWGCESDDMNALSDVLYVRRNGADMPAYI